MPVYWEKCFLIYNVKNLKFRIILFHHEATVMKDPMEFTCLKNVIVTFNNVYQA